MEQAMTYEQPQAAPAQAPVPAQAVPAQQAPVPAQAPPVQQAPVPPAQQPVPPVQQQTPAQPPEGVPEALVSREDQDRYGEELARDGHLSEASYAELARKGLHRDLVDQFIRGQEAATERFFNEVYAFVGGQERYDAMMRWAASGLSAEEKAAYNEMLGSKNITTVKAGLSAVYNAFERANPAPPSSSLSGTGAASGAGGGADVYRSREEMAVDMGRDEYWKNPAEQRRVAEKISRSIAAGVKL